ncbi:uncharacterized protein LOC134183894 isoform X2 [Corticium candelabrum]|uniref:uncharacterized protein LOC134183894 isoform X2 n=1 Tax=Corticium candelabrum TaxID=121492 RepID=UPI002E31DC85|nr:uncharacterized protein LOC134183894 isoform X2 [Corticium candelabrum]
MTLLWLGLFVSVLLCKIDLSCAKPGHAQFDDFRIKISASSPLARPGWTTTFKVQLLGNSNSDSSLRFVYTLSLNGTSYLRKWSRYRAKFTYKWLEDTPAGLCEVQLAVLYLDKKDEVTLVAKKSTQILATRAKLSISSNSPTPPGGYTHFTFEVEDSLRTYFMYNWKIHCTTCASGLAQLQQGSVNGTKSEDLQYKWSPDAEVGEYFITVDVYIIGNNGCVITIPIDSTSLTFELTDKIIANFELRYSGSQDLICPSCCAIPGEFDFYSTIHNPGGFYDTTSLIFEWKFNFPKKKSEGGSDNRQKPKHDSTNSQHPGKRSSYKEGEEVITQEVLYPGRYNYTLVVTGNAYETGEEHSGQTSGTICIQDPLSNVWCEMEDEIRVLENSTIKLFSNGSYPVQYCISTCDNADKICTRYVNSSASIKVFFQKAGKCFVNITAANNVSTRSSMCSLYVSDVSDTETSSGPSYAVPVVGSIAFALVVVAVLVGIQQYRAYKKRTTELTFEYIDRPPAYNVANLWTGVKSTVQGMIQRPQNEEKRPLHPQPTTTPQQSDYPFNSHNTPFQSENPLPRPQSPMAIVNPYNPPNDPMPPQPSNLLPQQYHIPQQTNATSPPTAQQPISQPHPYISPAQQQSISQQQHSVANQHGNSTKSHSQSADYQRESTVERSRDDSPPRLMPWADSFVSFASFGTFAPPQH